MLRVYRNMTRRTRILVLVALIAIVAAVIIGMGLSTIPIRSDTLKAKVIALLSDQLESEVTIESLEGRVFPRVSVSGRGVDHITFGGSMPITRNDFPTEPSPK